MKRSHSSVSSIRKSSRSSSYYNQIVKTGQQVLSKKPKICETVGIPHSHYPPVFDLVNADGRDLPVAGTRRVVRDETASWMTDSIRMKKWFSKDKELLQKLGILTLMCPTVSEMKSREYAAFLAMMKRFWPKAKHVFAYNAGGLATNEAAKAMVAQVMIENGLKPKQMKLVALEKGFHGRHGWGVELTQPSHKIDDWQCGRVIHLPSPYIVYDEVGNEIPKETKKRVTTTLAELKKAFQRPEVAGIMFEYPFQAEGGAYVLPVEFLEGVRILCDRYRKFLAIDAVQMGGKGWPVLPREGLRVSDYICFGKFSRVCGILAKDPQKRGFKVDHLTLPAKYGATWAGRLADMVAIQAMIRVIEENKLWENGKKMAQRFYRGLVRFAKAGKPLIRPRIRGTYVGFEFPTKEIRDEFSKQMYEKENTLVLPAGEVAVRWSAMLDAEIQEIDDFLEKIDRVLKRF